MRIVTLAIALIALLFAGRARAADSSLFETKLQNGLRVVVDENHRLPLVSVTVRYDVGSGRDPEDQNGLTELVTRMMGYKTEHVPEKGIDDAIDRAGGTWGSDTNVDDLDFYAQLPANAIETAFWIFSDQMGSFKPAIDDAAIKHAVQLVAIDRGNRMANAAMGLVNESTPQELFPAGHPYRHVPRASDATTLEKVTVADVAAHADKYFIPSNAVLAVVGDVSRDRVVALANKWFGAIAAGTPPPPQSIPSTPANVHLDFDARVERPVVRMVWTTPAQYQPGDAELDVVASILHGYRIARLSWELITKLKVAGEISVSQSSHRRGSTFTIQATATPKHTADEVAAAIDDVLRTLQTSQPPSEDDMEGALSSALMERTLSMEGSEYRARQLARWAIRAGTADYWQNDMHRYETDPARVQQTAVRYLPLDKRLVVYVNPKPTAPVAGQLVGRKVK